MKRKRNWLVISLLIILFLFLGTVGLFAFQKYQLRKKKPVINWKTYTNNQYNFSIKYPSSWEIETEGGDYFITFIPSREKLWHPEKPEDIPKNPQIEIVFGKYVKEKLGPKNFPETVSPEIFENWLRSKVNTGEGEDFSKRTIDRFQAFEITEISTPGRDKVIYWRTTSLDDLIRIRTGCESQYLNEFNQVVNSLKQIK